MKKRLLPILLFYTHPAFSADAALTQCRQIEAIQDRVACYDTYVDSQKPAAEEPKEPAASTSEVPDPIAVPDAQTLFGTSDAEAKRIVETTMSIEQIEQIKANVADVHKSATRKLTVALDNGQVWRQLDSKSLRLENGEAVIIRKASLGSYLMEKESGSRSIRVKRVN